MAFSPQTYRLKINLENGVFIDRNNMPTQPAGYIKSIPPLWANQSFELVFLCVEDNADTKASFDGGTAKLYIKTYNDDDVPTLLSTGTISGTDKDTITFVVDRDVLSATYADPRVSCLLYAEITTADRLTVIAQVVTITSENGTETVAGAVYNLTYSTTATIPAANGRRWVFCATGASWTLTLPSAATYPTAELIVVKTSAANTLTIAPAGVETINGTAGNLTIAAQWQSVILKSNGTNWVESTAAFVPRSLYDAQTILAATTDNTPAAVTVGEQTVVGRLTGGNIKAISTAELAGLLSGQSLTLATVNGTTFDTNVAAAGVTLVGTTLAADGTDADISISVTPKGTGSVVISKVDVDGGTIDGTTIGATTPAAGTFTTLIGTNVLGRASMDVYWNGSAFSTASVLDDTNPGAVRAVNIYPGGYDAVFMGHQTTATGGTVKPVFAIGAVGRSSWSAADAATQISDLYFLVRNNADALVERLRITSGGNVLLGTATEPATAARLVVKGSTADGSTNCLTLQDSAGAAVMTVNTYGVLSTPGGINVGTIGSYQRLSVDGNGVLNFGPADGAADTNLYRSAANVLKTDDSLHVAADFRHLGSNLGFFNVAAAAQRTHVADPSGGTTVDAEARSAINAILATLETYGLHAAS
jgi:hypothetical protein